MPEQSERGSGQLREVPEISLDPASIAIDLAGKRLADIYVDAHPAAQSLIDRVSQQPPLGMGTEKLVYPYGEGKVASFMTRHWSTTHYTPERQKANFYRRKLLHLLLPDGIPDIHLAGTVPPMLILERIEPPANKVLQALAAIRRPRAKRRLKQKLQSLGIGYELNPADFVTNRKGKSSYVDNLNHDGMDRPAVEAAIEDLSPEEQAKALRYLARLDKFGVTRS
jgi:hypothetical protein